MNENEKFEINSDRKAEWALLKIREEEKESERYIKTCEAMIEQYQDEIKKEKENLENKTSFFKTLLAQYFDTVQRKITKTQETYRLPSATLRLKYQQPDIKKDNDKLLSFVKDLKFNKFIEKKETIKWGEFKKELIQKDDKLMTKDGIIVDGIELIEKNYKFVIDFKI